MADSILDTIKLMLGVELEDTVFDQEIIIHINSTFSTLQQLGVGPESGYLIADKDDTWDEFIGLTGNIQQVKSYVYLKVRMIFDPPTTSFQLEAFNKQIQELEWRLNVQTEGQKWPMTTEPIPS